MLDWSCDVSMQASLRATLECAKSFSTTDLRGDLRSFTVPTLIIHGTADQTVPIDASARAAAKGISGSTLIEYDGAPHGLLASHKTRRDRRRDEVPVAMTATLGSMGVPIGAASRSEVSLVVRSPSPVKSPSPH